MSSLFMDARQDKQAIKTNGVTKYTYHRVYFHTIYYRKRCNPKFKKLLHCFDCSLLIFLKLISLKSKQVDNIQITQYHL